MPSPTTTRLPIPKEWDEFEDIVADVLKLRWKNPNVARNGRNGQRQHGVDIYGIAAHLPHGEYAGAQCKNSEITFDDVDATTADASKFKPTLREFLIATRMFRDAPLQEKVRIFNQKRLKAGEFAVEILFWEDLSSELAGSRDSLAKHFSGWSGLADREPQIDLKWAIEGREETEIRVVPVERSLWDFEHELRLFPEFAFAYMAHRIDVVEAMRRYNDEARALLKGKQSQQWLAHHAPARFKAGTAYALSLSVSEVPADDILVTLEFPDELEVFSPSAPPAEVVPPPLPRRPRAMYERQLSDSAALLSAELCRLVAAGGFRAQVEPILLTRKHVRLHSPACRVKDNCVNVHVNSLAHSRKQVFAPDRDDGVVIAARNPGTYKVPWTASARNRRLPCEGRLVVVVQHDHGANTEGQDDASHHGAS